jgi:Cu/Ag efflux pump CusA
MIEKIIEYSIRNRFVVIVVALVVIAWGIYAVINTPVDAIPDLSENQVIVFTDWMGRSPREIEDQITYPLSVNLQGLAGVKSVRSSSEFNFSMINVIFEDGVDFYFARQRVLERLTLASTFLPPGVVPYLAPDATALGQIFWYTVEGDGYDLGRLRAIQDWYVRYQLNSVHGVAQVASVGGYPIEYQIDVDPNKLRAYGVTLGDLYNAVARANSAVGGRVIHKGNAEYLIRGVGWLGARSDRPISLSNDVVEDIENIVVKSDPQRGTPIYVSNVASVGLGTQFRRSVLEKNGNETVGAVVMMRHGENPLAVTRAIKKKIEELQPGLPERVRIVPFYDRTRLIHGAIHTLTEILTHEMIIASLAVLLILMHFRSAFVICLTMPLAVLMSFIIMWTLRKLGIADIQSNIMSLAGIAISIGILVDQAIVMVENATHHLTAKFGKEKVRGDIRELIIPACRTVGRPIFFSVLIILISFIPVFVLRGQEGKTFHPLAFTKSFAMIGVAIISITLVPALIPTFIRGRIRSEEESWLVRTMIDIYKPVLSWAMNYPKVVNWFFVVLLGLGWHLSGKLPREYMPPLDEGSVVDMPITVPRASVAEVADDIKVRDELLRSFPEVEMVVGKAGRADTPTDPAPLDMLETVVTLRPKELWPKRKIRFDDGERQARVVLQALIDQGFVSETATDADRNSVVNTAMMNVLTPYDAAMRKFIRQRQIEFENKLAPQLTKSFATDLVRRWRRADRLLRPVEPEETLTLADELNQDFGLILAAGPAQEDVNRLVQRIAEELSIAGAVEFNEELLTFKTTPLRESWMWLGEQFGVEKPTLFTELYEFIHARREELWKKHAAVLDDEIFERAVGTFNWYAIEELLKAAGRTIPMPDEAASNWVPSTQYSAAVLRTTTVPGNSASTPYSALSTWDSATELGAEADDVFAGSDVPAQSHESQPQSPESQPRGPSGLSVEALHRLREQLDGPFAKWLFLWKKEKKELGENGGEMDLAIQMPGWGNIFTQPIINRIDMLATGIRTPVGIKVFGKDPAEIQRVSEEIAAVVQQVPGVGGVVPDQNIGKGYVEITIDRQKAARYGVSVGDIQDVIEVALGGKAITMTVEGRERHPVRLRYARDWREDEEQVKNLLVNANVPMQLASAAGSMGSTSGMSTMTNPPMFDSSMSAQATPPLQIPLSQVADVQIVEGPAMIKSENGMLRSYVQVTVAGRDVIGFVEEAQRLVKQKVESSLPPGMYLQWSGQFENQMRARQTLQIVVPAVIVIIFIILYLTYNDLMDALLMMMAVPEAIVGGIFFLWLFNFKFSVAVWVGFIACLGMATETGIIMLVYLREAIDRRGGLAKIASLDELRQTVIEGAVHRLRPKLLTEGVAILALAPMLWHTGVGHEVITAMAAPVLGGLLIADEVVDIFIPVRFFWVRRARWLKLHRTTEGQTA